MMIGTLPVARISRQIVKPSLPGSIASRTIRSMLATCRTLRISRSSRATLTRYPLRVKNRDRRSRISLSSSTMRMCGVFSIGCRDRSVRLGNRPCQRWNVRGGQSCNAMLQMRAAQYCATEQAGWRNTRLTNQWCHVSHPVTSRMFETRPPQLRHWRDHHENPPTDSCCIRRRVPYASRVRRHHGEQPRRLHGVAAEIRQASHDPRDNLCHHKQGEGHACPGRETVQGGQDQRGHEEAAGGFEGAERQGLLTRRGRRPHWGRPPTGPAPEPWIDWRWWRSSEKTGPRVHSP